MDCDHARVMDSLQLKRGSTLDLQCQAKSSSAPLDITGWVISCWGRDTSDRLVQKCTVVITDAASGKFSVHVSPADTALWPLGKLLFDIRYQDAGGTVMATETFDLYVLKAQTGVE